MKNLPFIALCLFLVLACKTVSNSDKPKTVSVSENTAINKQVTEKPLPVIKAVELSKLYADNEISADEKFKDKQFQVSGKVSNIAEVLGTIQVDLESHKQFFTVKCTFDESEKSEVAKLKKGQNAVFIGTVTGQTLNLFVAVENCKIK